MIRTIDRYNGMIIQKVTFPNGQLIRYQTGREDEVGKANFTPFTALADARRHIGLRARANSSNPPTPPKSAHPQNQKGYMIPTHSVEC